MSLNENAIFLGKINELENALKSRVQPQVYFAKTHSQKILYLQAPPFKPITVTAPDTNNSIPFVSIKSNEAPKSTVKIVEIFPEKDSKRVDENDKSNGPSKKKNLKNVYKPVFINKEKEKVFTPKAKIPGCFKTASKPVFQKHHHPGKFSNVHSHSSRFSDFKSFVKSDNRFKKFKQVWRVKGSTYEVDNKKSFVHKSNLKKNNISHSKSFVKSDFIYSDNKLIRWSQKKFCCSYCGTNDFVKKEYVNSWYDYYNVLNYKSTTPNQKGPKFRWVPKSV